MIYLKQNGDQILLAVHAQPRSSRAGIAGLHGDCLKIAVNAPPVDGAANEEISHLLAETLGLPKQNVSLVRGATGREKTFSLRGISLAEAAKRLGGK